jgi:hypothetical protein
LYGRAGFAAESSLGLNALLSIFPQQQFEFDKDQKTFQSLNVLKTLKACDEA